ncbi:MAG: epoxyqueuosine reductase [Candidatus Izemoplasmatales bacterium]
MKSIEIKNIFKKEFDLVGVIHTKEYIEKAKLMNKAIPDKKFPTMVVLALAYPKRMIKQNHTHLVASFYTFGKDYHLVMKEKIQSICDHFDFAYEYGVDNHPLDERLAASIAGLGYFAKNQLIINKDYGSYIFLAYVLLDIKLDQEIKYLIDDDCKDCTKCIEACPTNALQEGSYIQERCMSHYNQSKKILSEEEIKKNYTLFGCDICQMVCPKNIKKGQIVHPEFELSNKEKVSIEDLFTLSQKDFNQKYNDMAYLWKGKTILMRNALTLLLNQKNTSYNHLIEKSISKFNMPWYKETAEHILKELKKVEN